MKPLDPETLAAVLGKVDEILTRRAYHLRQAYADQGEVAGELDLQAIAIREALARMARNGRGR